MPLLCLRKLPAILRGRQRHSSRCEQLCRMLFLLSTFRHTWAKMEDRSAECTCRAKQSSYLEQAVSDIRSASGWIQRVAEKRKRMQASLMPPTSSQRPKPLPLSATSLPSATSLLSAASLLSGTSFGADRRNSAVIQLELQEISNATRTESVSSSSSSSSSNSIMLVPSLQAEQGNTQSENDSLYRIDKYTAVEWAADFELQEQNERSGSLSTRLTSTRTAYFALFATVQAALVAFLASLHRALKDKVGSELFWHPVLMCATLLLTTEAVVILQHAHWAVPPNGSRYFRRLHGILQCTALVSGVSGAILGTHKHYSTGSLPHMASAHSRLGAVVFALVLTQALLGIAMACSTQSSSHSGYAKRWHKCHRALGYLALIGLWTSAWLGVHTPWVQTGQKAGSGDASQNPSERTWLAIFALLILGVLLPINAGKFGFR